MDHNLSSAELRAAANLKITVMIGGGSLGQEQSQPHAGGFGAPQHLPVACATSVSSRSFGRDPYAPRTRPVGRWLADTIYLQASLVPIFMANSVVADDFAYLGDLGVGFKL